jgi:hypothetical protein
MERSNDFGQLGAAARSKNCWPHPLFPTLSLRVEVKSSRASAAHLLRSGEKAGIGG